MNGRISEHCTTHKFKQATEMYRRTHTPPPRGRASCSALHGRVTHANSATGLGKLLGTILEPIAGHCRRRMSRP